MNENLLKHLHASNYKMFCFFIFVVKAEAKRYFNGSIIYLLRIVIINSILLIILRVWGQK
jgi:hypothetical protein